MANRWWLGATTDWSDANNWSATEGGAGGASVPTDADNAYFSDTSGSGNCTLTADSECLNLYTRSADTGGTDNWTGTLNTAGHRLDPAGAFEFRSAGTLTLGASTVEVQGRTLIVGPTVNRDTSTLVLHGDFWGGSNEFYNVTLAANLTVQGTFYHHGKLRVSAGVTATIASTIRAISTGLGDVEVEDTGTLTGAGMLDLFRGPIERVALTGTISCIARFDVFTDTMTAVARAYGGEVIIRNGAASGAGTVRFGAGTWGITGNLQVDAASGANLTLDAATHNPTVNVGGNLDYTGTGAGNEHINFGSGIWTVGGAVVDFTGGTVTPGTSTLVMTGAGAVLTPAGNDLYRLTVQNSWRVVGAINVTNLFRCLEPGAVLTWAAGVTHVLNGIDIRGRKGVPIELVSNTPGTRYEWNLANRFAREAYYVRVSDCDARAGLAPIGIYHANQDADTHDEGNNLNWLFKVRPEHERRKNRNQLHMYWG